MCRADPSADPRPFRLINFLSQGGYVVDIVSPDSSSPLPIEDHYVILSSGTNLVSRSLHLLFRLSLIGLATIFRHSDRVLIWCNDLRYRIRSLESEIIKEYALIIVEDYQLLPLAFRIKTEAKIVFDARELYTSQNEESAIFRHIESPIRGRLCARFLPICDDVITVSKGLAAEYQTRFGIQAIVLRSVPFFAPLSPSEIDSKSIRIVHHGLANKNRQLHKMIDIVRSLDQRFSLDMYLTGPKRAVSALKKHAAGDSRIRFCNPMPLVEIVSKLNQYDIGFFYVEPSTLNLLHCLPNKLFEFIQARLAIVIGPSPDMAEVVREFQCGFISREFSVDSVVSILQGLSTEEIRVAKLNSSLASETLCYEKEWKKFAELL